jgi:signal transduction histidine kinase
MTEGVSRRTTGILARGRLGTMGPRPTRGDWVVAGAVTVLSVLAPRSGPPSAPDPAWVDTLGLVLAGAQGLPTAWRRIRPILVAAIVLAAYLAYALIVDPVPPYAGWVMLFAVVVHSERHEDAALRGGIVAFALTAALAVVALTSMAGRDVLPSLLLITVVVALAAALTRAERARMAAVRANAALEERLRVARDLHDVVGHGLSAISVQSGTARVALDAGQLPAVRAALVNVESTSRAALHEMRQLLGVLRDASASVGLGDLNALVESTVGARGAVTQSGDLSRVPPVVALGAYRVVQEALTNVMKHAPHAHVTVSVIAVHNRLTVDITDDGPSGGRREAGGGHGLIGMRERVAALRGAIDAGPEGRRWLARARRNAT